MNKYFHRLHEFLYKLIGYRRTGAWDEPSPEDWLLVKPIQKELATSPYNMGDLSIYYQNQKNMPSCSAFALAHCINIEIRKKFHYQSDVRGIDLWENQKKDADSDLSTGDSLQHAMKCAHKYKAFDHVKKKTFDIQYFRVDKKDVLSALEDNLTLYTGLLADSPLCNESYFWRNTGKGSGHAINGFDGKRNNFGKFLNSWKNFGFKRTGVFYVHPKDINSMFTFYAISVID